MNKRIIFTLFISLSVLVLASSISIGQDISSSGGFSNWFSGNLWSSVFNFNTESFWHTTGKKMSFFQNKKPQETSTRYYGDWQDRKAPPKRQTAQKTKGLKGFTGSVIEEIPPETEIEIIQLPHPGNSPSLQSRTGTEVLQTGKSYVLHIFGGFEFPKGSFFDSFYQKDCEHDSSLNLQCSPIPIKRNEILYFNGRMISQTLLGYPSLEKYSNYRVPFQGDGQMLTVSGTYANGSFSIYIYESCAVDSDCPSGRVCSNKVCACPSGTSLCGKNCVNLQNNNDNCGQCNNACQDGSTCAGGRCKKDNGKTCNDNDDCKSTHCVHDVCRETDPYCDDTYCDTGEKCSQDDSGCTYSFDNAQGKCSNGCQMGSCNSGYGNCNNDQSDGCEISLSDSNDNCGACNKKCPSGKQCENSKCVITCEQGETKCNGLCVDTSSDLNNCGECDNRCPFGKSCQSGECVVSCSGGKVNCGGICVDVLSDKTNCGSCGVSCRFEETCSKGSCTQPKCPLGKLQCGTVCVDTTSDEKNCGGCNKKCQTGEACQNSKCTLTCGPEETTCNRKCVDTGKDASNCGGCNKKCQTGEACQNSICQKTTLCTNEKKDRDESDIDCGGSCETKCDPGKKCLDSDKKSQDSNCEDDKCIQGVCAEKCGEEVYCLPQKDEVCKTVSTQENQQRCMTKCGTEFCSTKTQKCDPITKKCQDLCSDDKICPPNQSCIDNQCQTVASNSLDANARCKKDNQCKSWACTLKTKRCAVA